ncbi:hypothetical protein [Cryptosporangium minutisporangium]|uniref:Uncharacterized protein n=1 Tax=Cryptosporangium minutisporangium TaxID=113569 RepID=A0ABP6T0L5_9ACTN
MSRSPSHWPALAAAALLAFTLPAVADTPAAASSTIRSSMSSLTGTARLSYPIAADNVRFSFDVHADATGSGPQKAHGTLHIRHYVSGERTSYFWTARAECLLTSGRVAVVTGTITDTSPKLEPWRGQRLSFTVVDGQPDQTGTSGPRPVSEAPACQVGSKTPATAPAPLMQVTSGGYRVHDGQA